MTEFLQYTGSFAAVLLATWLLLFVLFTVFYPLVRKFLFRWHPSTASNVLLILLAFPFVTSLLSTIMLFSPLLSTSLISTHVHTTECYKHLPLLQSDWMIGLFLSLAGISLLVTAYKFVSNLRYSRSLMTQLSSLGKKHKNWFLLPHQHHLVFTLGWLKNTIFITEGLLRQCSKQDLDIILEHEREHVRRKDNIRLLVGRLLLLFIPARFAGKYYEDLHLFTEAACDFKTAVKHGNLNVAETLLRIQRLVPHHFNYFNKSMVSAFTGSEIESRIQYLLTRVTPVGKCILPVVGVVGLLLLSVALVDPLHHGVEWVLGEKWMLGA